MFLLDTNVVSETRRARPDAHVVQWLSGVADADLHVSAVTIGELQAGVEKLRESEPVKAGELEAWIELVALSYSVIDMDQKAFRLWARLMHRQSHHLVEDAMIAATAQTHGLCVVTRNVRDFELLGVATLNPFEPA